MADGLRAESLYRDDLNRTPFLREIILHEGMHGVAHTRVPTESRPGHVALTAGLYEDPSAVLKGWQDNPVDFDSIFNRSRVSDAILCDSNSFLMITCSGLQETFAWGSPDIMTVFTKQNVNNHIVANAYTAEKEDISGKTNTSQLDLWVFDKATEFLHKSAKNLVHKERTIFFLHLLGLDTGIIFMVDLLSVFTLS